MAEDAVELGLDQAQMVAFCVPGAGPALAAAASLFKAAYTAFAKNVQQSTYSTSKAIADLGEEVANLIGDSSNDARMAVVNGWGRQSKRFGDLIASYETAPVDDGVIDSLVAKFIRDDAADTAFGAFTAPEGTEARVKELELYLPAVAAYNAMCTSMLQYQAVQQGLSAEKGWTFVHSPVRVELEKALAGAPSYAEKTVAGLEHAIATCVADAHEQTKSIPAGAKRNAAFTRALRKIRADAFLQDVTPDRVVTYRNYLLAFDAASKAFADHPLGKITPTGGGATGNKLGPRKPKTARFLYESDPHGSWVGVLSDPAVSVGYTVAQDAGSLDPGRYYRVAGGTINSAFNTVLTANAQLGAVENAIKTKYNATGRDYDTDAASPPASPPLCSFLIPLSPSPPAINRVVAMIYSVGPKLDPSNPTGIVDEADYKRIYSDALAEISKWNGAVKGQPIDNFRIALLSTGAYAGASAGPKLDAQAAGLVIDAVVAAMTGNPLLSTLTILVNTNDSAGGAERSAFDAAAVARGVTPLRDGFDIDIA